MSAGYWTSFGELAADIPSLLDNILPFAESQGLIHHDEMIVSIRIDYGRDVIQWALRKRFRPEDQLLIREVAIPLVDRGAINVIIHLMPRKVVAATPDLPALPDITKSEFQLPPGERKLLT